MKLSIELNKDNAVLADETYPSTGLCCIAGGYDWVPALKAAATQIQTLNEVATELLVNGPLACNPESTITEGFLGIVNTPPTEFGHVQVDIPNYAMLRLTPELLMMLAPVFNVIYGDASGDVVTETMVKGEPVQVVDNVPVGGLA